MSTPSITQIDTAAVEAATAYIQRQARLAHPSGSFDNARRWHPSDAERQACCRAIRSPSRHWPFSLMTHCRTLAHVAACYGVAPAAVRRALRTLDVDAVSEHRAVRSGRGATITLEPIVTPEMTLREAGVSDARQAEYQRKMSALLAGGG